MIQISETQAHEIKTQIPLAIEVQDWQGSKYLVFEGICAQIVADSVVEKIKKDQEDAKLDQSNSVSTITDS